MTNALMANRPCLPGININGNDAVRVVHDWCVDELTGAALQRKVLKDSPKLKYVI